MILTPFPGAVSILPVALKAPQDDSGHNSLLLAQQRTSVAKMSKIWQFLNKLRHRLTSQITSAFPQAQATKRNDALPAHELEQVFRIALF